jgi:hypothetical protein
MGTERREGGKVKGPLIVEIGQSVFLMGLMAAFVAIYVGLGLLAARVLGS